MAWVQPPEEAVACEVLRRSIGADFTELDDNTRPGMVDGLFVLPDGVEGALEVTTAGEEVDLELEARTLGRDWDAPDRLDWAWNVWVRRGVNNRFLKDHLISYLEVCELAGVTNLRTAGSIGASSMHQLLGPFVRGVATPESTRHGNVNVLPDTASGGTVGHDANAIVDWADTLLQRPLMVRKLQKLQRSRRPEQHLAVRVHQAGLPWPVLDALMGRSDAVPTRALHGSHDLTALWLLPRWGVPLRWWHRDGWCREDVLDQRPRSE